MPNIIYEGEKYTIEAAICSNGSIPSKNFIKDLPKNGRAKINALFKRFADIGEIRDTRKFKKLKGFDLFEFKCVPLQIRILCYFTKGRLIILTHGFYKKENETKKSEIKRAIRIKNEYETLKAKGFPL